MDIVFAAEQYAQAQAAVAAAAQYYTNAAISAANGPIAPAAPIIVTSAAGPLGLIQAQAAAAAAAGHPQGPSIISGTQVLGPQFLNAALATAATPLPQAPPPPPISIQPNAGINPQRVALLGAGNECAKRNMNRDSDIRDQRRDTRERHDRDHRYERDRGSDRDSYRSERYSRYDRDRDRSRRSDRDRNYDKRDREDRRRRDRSPARRNRSRSPYRRDRDRDCTPDSDDADKDIPPNNTIMVRGLAQHISENDIEESITSCGLQAKDIRLIRKKETGTVIDFLLTCMP